MITINNAMPEIGARKVSKKVVEAFGEIRSAQFSTAFQFFDLTTQILKRDYLSTGPALFGKKGQVLTSLQTEGARIVTVRKSRVGRGKHLRPNRKKPGSYNYYDKGKIFGRKLDLRKRLNAPKTSDISPDALFVSRTLDGVTFKMEWQSNRRLFYYRMIINGPVGATLFLHQGKKGDKARDIIVLDKSGIEKQSRLRGRQLIWLAMSKAITQWDKIHGTEIRKACGKAQKKIDSK